MSDDESDIGAKMPSSSELFAAQTVVGEHPCCFPIETLLDQCDLRTQRRSGPGGQHRNKTSSGVYLEHRPTGQIGEATERRSQADNRVVALERLRLKLAVVVRRCEADESDTSLTLREQYAGGAMKISMRNENFARVLALLMNDLWQAGGQPSLVAKRWQASTSSIVRLLRLHPPAIAMVNAYRKHHGRLPLK